MQLETKASAVTGVDETDAAQPKWAEWMWVPLALLVVLVYARTIGFGLFLDDYLLARPWSAHEVLKTFYGPFDPTNYNDPYFRPLASMSFAIEWHVWGTALWGYHLTNIALHTVVTMGLWLVLRQLRVTWWAAGVGAAFFAIVPSNAATAIYIAERTDAMVAAAVLFGLTCLWKYAKTRQPSQIVALNVAYALALLTKEIAVAMLPFAAVLWLFLNVEKTEPVSALVRGNLSSGLQHWGGELRIAWRAVFDPRARRDWIIVLAPLFICSLLYLVYRAEVMPPGSFRDRFGEGLNPVRALLAAMRGTFKGTPWEINNYTETPLVVAFAIGFVALPQARAWRTVLLGVGCMAAGVLPLCFNGGVEPRLLYVAEIGMAIAIAGLATVYGEALAATRHPATRVALATAFGVISLVTLAVVGSAQAAAQDAFEPGRPIQLKKDLLVWLHPSSIAYVPPENMKVIESQLREAGLIDSNGHPTVAAAGISNAGISKHR